MKRNLTMILVLIMMLGCFVTTANAELAPMTTEPITLRYLFWGQDLASNAAETAALVKQFTEKYPNITVEQVLIEQEDYTTALANMAQTGDLPDVFGVFEVSTAAMNEWALPIDAFYDADPDTAEMYEALAKNSLIGGKRYSMPWVLYPHVVYVNKTLFENYNEPLPSYDWTLDEYFEIAERMTHPEEFYFGIANPLFEDFYPAWYNGQGKWGWDGENYNFDEVWIAARDKRYEVMDNRILEWESEEDKEKWLGDPGAWPPAWGRVALYNGFMWEVPDFMNLYTQQSGCEFLLYPLPQGPTGKQLGIIDNAVVGASTKYPREAWELLKYMTWGEEAMLTRQAAAREAGVAVTRLPISTNKAAWQDLIDNADREDLIALYSHLTDIVPSNWPVAPGWFAFERWTNENDIWGKLDRREVTPADIAAELNAKANEIKDQWLAELAAK